MMRCVVALLFLGYVAANQLPPYQCKDGKECPGLFPCCDTGKDDACCPIADGVCCKGTSYCCPPDYTCNSTTVSCQHKNATEKAVSGVQLSKPRRDYTLHRVQGVTDALTKLGAVKDQKCDNETTCPSDETCCKVQGGYGCCPYPNATCCDDLEHCCPHGYTCEEASGSCVKRNDHLETLPLVRKIPARSKDQTAPTVTSVICPDGESQCSSGETCCKLASGKYGCCPYSSATCCSDHLHCCPHGYTCDETKGECIGSDKSHPFLQKLPARSLGVVCPGKRSQCPANHTCCQIGKEKVYACCPRINATCCSDGFHCCPQNYTCNLNKSVCEKKPKEKVFMSVIESGSRQLQSVKNVMCPDGQSQCASGQTCCSLESTGYGCCPGRNSVCCKDHKNCCPHGYECDLDDHKCRRDSTATPLVPKLGVFTSPLQHLHAFVKERKNSV